MFWKMVVGAILACILLLWSKLGGFNNENHRGIREQIREYRGEQASRYAARRGDCPARFSAAKMRGSSRG